MCVCARAGIQYIHVLFFRFNVYICTDLVKHGVFTLVGGYMAIEMTAIIMIMQSRYTHEDKGSQRSFIPIKTRFILYKKRLI